MSNWFRIARNTFQESLREPVSVLLLFAVLAVIAIYPACASFVFYEEQKFVTDGTMATIWFGAFLCATVAAGNTVCRELRNGAILLILAKPVGRFTYFAGKLAGVVAGTLFFGIVSCCGALTALAAATDTYLYETPLVLIPLGILVVAALIGAAMNFLRGTSFAEWTNYMTGLLTVGFCLAEMTTTQKLPFDLAEAVKALLALLAAMTVLGTLAGTVAFYFDFVPTLGVMFGVFLTGTLSQFFFVRETGIAALDFLLRIAYAVLPDWQLFWLADAVAMKHDIPWRYVAWAWCDALTAVALVILWGNELFIRREAAAIDRKY